MDRKITIWSVCDKETGKPITIVRKKDEAHQYMDKYVRIKYNEHFSMWCNLRNLNPNDERSWHTYVVNCMPEEEGFILRKGKVPVSALMASFRAGCHCVPLGMPWELTAEVANFIDRLPDKTKDLLDKLSKEFADCKTPEEAEAILKKGQEQLMQKIIGNKEDAN